MAWLEPRSGELRHRVRIERANSAASVSGYSAPAWETLYEHIPAKIAAKRGGEAVQARRLAGTVDHDITIRSTPDTRSIRASDRIVHEGSGETYAIVTPPLNLDGLDRFLTLTATTGKVVA